MVQLFRLVKTWWIVWRSLRRQKKQGILQDYKIPTIKKGTICATIMPVVPADFINITYTVMKASNTSVPVYIEGQPEYIGDLNKYLKEKQNEYRLLKS